MKKKAIIISIKGYNLSIKEKMLIANEKPWGLILFKRNISTLNQTRKLIKSIDELNISDNHIYNADYIYNSIKTLNKNIIPIILNNKIEKSFIEKICKLSSFYNKEDSKILKKQVTKYFKL